MTITSHPLTASINSARGCAGRRPAMEDYARRSHGRAGLGSVIGLVIIALIVLWLMGILTGTRI